MKKAFVFLDLDDTILDFHMAEHTALKKALAEMGFVPTQPQLERYSVINAEQWRKLEDGLLTRDEVLVTRFDRWFEELGLPLSGEEAAERYEGYLHEGHWFVPGAEALLEALQGEYGLYLASNGVASVQHSRLKSAGIAPLFDGIFISEELGANKPDPAYFEACFARIPDFSRDRAIIVGDSLSSDIRGGRRAGIKTCWFNPRGKTAPEEQRADHEIARLEELPALLDTLFG